MNLEPIMIDITTKPPTPEYLANKRREATAKKTAIARRRVFTIWTTFFVEILTLAGIWVTTGSLVAPTAVLAIIIWVRTGAKVMIVIGGGLAIVSILRMVLGGIGSPVDLIGTLMFAVMLAVVVCFSFLYDNYLQKQLDQAMKHFQIFDAQSEVKDKSRPTICEWIKKVTNEFIK